MKDPHEIAKAFITEAKDDIDAASLMVIHKMFSKCMEHSQKAVEKILKAGLALKGVTLAEHRISGYFISEYKDALPDDLLANIKEATVHLESKGARFEYPFFGRDDLPIWIPSKEVTEADAREAYRIAKEIFSGVTNFLATKYGIKLV